MSHSELKSSVELFPDVASGDPPAALFDLVSRPLNDGSGGSEEWMVVLRIWTHDGSGWTFKPQYARVNGPDDRRRLLRQYGYIA